MNEVSPAMATRPQPQQKKPEQRSFQPATSERIAALARDLFVRMATVQHNLGKTADHLAGQAFDQAETFWAVADSRK
jgi:hypothetical protein